MIADPKIHVYADTRSAYDDSQCREEITDGDILIAFEEGAIAILCKAWPVALTEDSAGEQFHRFQLVLGDTKITYEEAWKDREYAKYERSVELARKIFIQKDLRS